MIAFSKFFLKSFLEPRKLGFAKLRREKYSERSFYGMASQVNLRRTAVNACQDLTWIGVPERMTRRLTLRPLRAWNV